MLAAVIGDIHGNLPALQSVLGDIDDAGIQTILNTGDAVAGLPWPRETLDLLREREIPSTQGETDRMVATFLKRRASFERTLSPARYAALSRTHDQLRGSDIERLRDLPRHLRFTFDGIDLFLCHGTPASASDELAETDDDDRFRRAREVANADIVVVGRTHVPHARTVDDVLFVNPGSVGIPAVAGEGVASYAVIDTEAIPWTARLHRVTYDFASVAERLREMGLDLE